MRRNNENEAIEIERFIHSVMTLGGMERGRDYTLSKSRLKIKKHPVRGKLLSVLRETYPEFTYYWETPKILRWF